MRYADPHACPRCRASIGGVTACPSCGFDLTSRAAHELWSLFARADAILAGATAAATSAPVPEPLAGGVLSSPIAAPVTVPPGQHAPIKSRSWSAGSILLGLGALSLVVAAIIFVSLTWGSLGVAGRTLVLLIITAIFGALVALCVHNRLFASAEALAFVLLGMLTVDVFGAKAAGFLGMSNWPKGAVFTLWAVVMGAAAFALDRQAATRGRERMYIPEIFAGIAVIVSMPVIAHWINPLKGSADLSSWTWALLLGTLLACASFYLFRLLNIGLTAQIIVVFTGLWAVATVLQSWMAFGLAPGQWHWPSAIALLIVIAALTAAGMLSNRIRIPAWVLASLSVSAVLVLSVARLDLRWYSDAAARAEYFPLSAWLAVGVLALLVSAWAFFKPANSDVRQTRNWTLGFLAAGLAPASLPMQLPLFFRASEIWENLEPAATDRTEILIGSAVLVLVCSAFIVLMLFTFNLRDEQPILFRLLRDFGIPGLVVLFGTQILALANAHLVVLTVPAIALIVVWSLRARDIPTAQLLGLLPAAAALALMPHSVPWSVLVPYALGVALANSAWRAERAEGSGPLVSSGVLAATSIALLAGGTMAMVWMDREPTMFATGVLVVVLAGLHVVNLGLRAFAGIRLGVDTGLALFFSGVLLSTAGFYLFDLAPFWSFSLALAAASTAIVAMADSSRRWQMWLAMALGTIAWWLLLVHRDIATLEWYTLPPAVVLIGIGSAKFASDPESRSWFVLGPGLALGLLPSLSLALDEPAGLRALMLGCAALVIIGAAVVLRWQAPFVLAGSVLLILVFLNLWPVVFALHRWIIFASAGAILVAVGTTWEKRVANGRAAVTYISAMR